MTPPVWIREHGVRACLCTVGVCRERKRSGSKSAERASEERRGSGQWLGSDQTEPSHKRRIQMCLYLARLPFLSFPLPFLRHAFHLARARGRLVLFTLLIVIAWTVTQAQPLGTLPSTVFFPPRPALLRNPNCGSSRDHRNLFNADCCSVKLFRLYRSIPVAASDRQYKFSRGPVAGIE